MSKAVYRQYRKQRLELIPLTKGGWGGWVHFRSDSQAIVGNGTSFSTMEECLAACKSVVDRSIQPEDLL